MSPSMALSRALHAGLAAVWALALMSAFRLPAGSRAYHVVLILLVVAAARRPAVGLLLLALLVPLASALLTVASVPLPIPLFVESVVLAFLLGLELRAVIRGADGPPARLTWPALTLGAVVASAGLTAELAQYCGGGPPPPA